MIDSGVSSLFNIPINFTPKIVIAVLFLVFGLICVLIGGSRLSSILISYLMPEKRGKLRQIFMKSSDLGQAPNVVVIGGGTGLYTILSGLKNYTRNLTAVVAMSDMGDPKKYCTPRLRSEFGILPPGDIRKCLVALSDDKSLMSDLLQYKFDEGKQLKGHSVGNLLLTALVKINKGDFEKAVNDASKILTIRGKVLPVSIDNVHLCAELENGKIIKQEQNVECCAKKYKSPIKRLFLEPKAVITKKTNEAIKKADMIVLGPGSLYTSILPNLIVSGVKDAIKKSRAKIVYVCNVMTKPGETDNYTAYDHVKKIVEYLGVGVLDFIVVNKEKAPEKLYNKYKESGARRVKADEDNNDDGNSLLEFGAEVVSAKLLTKKDLLRHDSDKLAKTVMNILKEN